MLHKIKDKEYRTIVGDFGFGMKIYDSTTSPAQLKTWCFDRKEAREVLDCIREDKPFQIKTEFQGFVPRVLIFLEKHYNAEYFCSNPTEANKIFAHHFDIMNSSKQFSYLDNIQEPEDPKINLNEINSPDLKKHAEQLVKYYHTKLERYDQDKKAHYLWRRAEEEPERFAYSFLSYINGHGEIYKWLDPVVL